MMVPRDRKRLTVSWWDRRLYAVIQKIAEINQKGGGLLNEAALCRILEEGEISRAAAIWLTDGLLYFDRQVRFWGSLIIRNLRFAIELNVSSQKPIVETGIEATKLLAELKKSGPTSESTLTGVDFNEVEWLLQTNCPTPATEC
jgi:hypothetical protein